MITNFRISTLALAVSLALGGCASSGDYAAKTPTPAVPSAFGWGETPAAAEQKLPALDANRGSDVRNDPWWQGFGDARLNQLVLQALDANSNLAAAGFALRQARLQAGLAENDLYPQASGSLSASASRSINHSDGTTRSSASSVGLSWEVDLWGRLRAARDVKSWQALASADDLQATAQSLVGDVCRDYWTLAYLNQSIAAGDKDLASLERTLKLVEVQYKEGDVSRLELGEAQQTLETQRAAQSALLQQRVETRNALTVLLDGHPLPLADEPQSVIQVTTLPVRAGIPAELLARRPDLRAAERRLRGSLANIDATARSYYPALTLTGAVGGGGTALSDVLRNPAATLGAGLDLPFLNVEKVRLNTEYAGAEYQQAASTFRTTLYTALQDVDNALSARTRLQEQAAARQRSYLAAQEVARMYEVRYREGNVALRIWLDAQQTLRASELALAQVLRDQVNNDVTLILALGGS
ncbi:efflux transporter outer membrane subunit [Duganella sp. FT80W]|uniref:Efflux transporter outer membrane subunit n=1 Tax=Duganella guangzhouensis TaxID=2666084 RepID=A0A6I2L624_9BURK|nr:efflux transporter outer membrane subunit [Duganella guangzhouensis]MRW93253.1 efflux transporter outer membrane subunit [Duganella guangzhouensis]